MRARWERRSRLRFPPFEVLPALTLFPGDLAFLVLGDLFPAFLGMVDGSVKKSNGIAQGVVLGVVSLTTPVFSNPKWPTRLARVFRLFLTFFYSIGDFRTRFTRRSCELREASKRPRPTNGTDGISREPAKIRRPL